MNMNQQAFTRDPALEKKLFAKLMMHAPPVPEAFLNEHNLIQTCAAKRQAIWARAYAREAIQQFHQVENNEVLPKNAQ